MACEVEVVLLINELDVPGNAVDWRYYQDNECMTFRQMRETHAGCALLRMRQVRREALLPVCIALVLVVAQFLYRSPLVQWAVSILLFIFINRVTLIAAVASLLVTKLRLVIPRCSRLAACIQSLVILTQLHLIRGYAEAYPSRGSRENTTPEQGSVSAAPSKAPMYLARSQSRLNVFLA
jgi:hypothetical protein